MGISTISFDCAKIYKNKMFFTSLGQSSTATTVMDASGKHIVSRISHKPSKKFIDDRLVISRKNEYEFPNKTIMHEYRNRIYDLAGRLKDTDRYTKIF